MCAVPPGRPRGPGTESSRLQEGRQRETPPRCCSCRALPAARGPTGITCTGPEGVRQGPEPWPLGTHRVRTVRSSEDIQAVHPGLCPSQTTCLSLQACPAHLSVGAEQGACSAGRQTQPARAGGHTVGAPLHRWAVKGEGRPSSSSRLSGGSSWLTELSSAPTSTVHIGADLSSYSPAPWGLLSNEASAPSPCLRLCLEGRPKLIHFSSDGCLLPWVSWGLSGHPPTVFEHMLVHLAASAGFLRVGLGAL